MTTSFILYDWHVSVSWTVAADFRMRIQSKKNPSFTSDFCLIRQGNDKDNGPEPIQEMTDMWTIQKYSSAGGPNLKNYALQISCTLVSSLKKICVFLCSGEATEIIFPRLFIHVHISDFF